MKKKILFSSVLLCLCFAAFSYFHEKRADGFTIAAIRSHRPYNPAWEVRPLTPVEKKELDQALSQKYFYFGCGGQSFILFSEDQKYAIKFFKQKVFRPKFWLHIPPIPWIFHRYYKKKIAIKEDKLRRDFESYKMAFEDLQEETGVIYVHLNKTYHLKNPLQIVDRLNREHLLDLNSLDFLVQKKAELVYERIQRLMREDNVIEAQKAIASALHLIVKRAKKGFHDRDPNIRTNCGFLKDEPIKIDVGRFVRNDSMKKPEIYQKEVLRISLPFGAWIKETYPTLYPSFEEEISKIMNEKEEACA